MANRIILVIPFCFLKSHIGVLIIWKSTILIIGSRMTNFQANREHQKNVAVLSRQYCQIEALKKTAYLIGLHHDEGKIQALWQQYFLSKIRGKDTSGRETVDHSTLED